MGILVRFINRPFSQGDPIDFGFQNQDAVDEFGALLKIPSMEDAVICLLPEKEELPKIMKIIKSAELKNILTAYAGREILLNPDSGETKTDLTNVSEYWYKDSSI